jgi:hypothetical protein
MARHFDISTNTPHQTSPPPRLTRRVVGKTFLGEKMTTWISMHLLTGFILGSIFVYVILTDKEECIKVRDLLWALSAVLIFTVAGSARMGI